MSPVDQGDFSHFKHRFSRPMANADEAKAPSLIPARRRASIESRHG